MGTIAALWWPKLKWLKVVVLFTYLCLIIKMCVIKHYILYILDATGMSNVFGETMVTF